MRNWVVGSVLRVATACALGVVVLATVVGWICHVDDGGRTRITASLAIVENGAQKPLEGMAATILDADAGHTEAAPSWMAETFSSAVLSPWRDEQDRKLVAGFSWEGAAKGERTHERRFGILLARYPDGEALSFAPLHWSGSLGGRLCWLPGTLARVLFPGRDGSLYRIDFERTDHDDRVVRLDEPMLHKITWQGPGWRGCRRQQTSRRGPPTAMGSRMIVSLRHAVEGNQSSPPRVAMAPAERVEHRGG